MAILGDTTVTKLTSIGDVTLSGTISGNGSGLTSLNASNISSGTLAAARLATSGVTAGSYGPTANVTGSNNATIKVPQITVDTYGRVTSVTDRVYTSVNTDSNTDTKNTAGSTDTSSKIFLVGATSQAANPQTYSHDTVFVDTNGRLNSAAPASTANDTTVATTKWVKDQSYTTATGHTHKYAGSSSAGGAATSLANFKVTTTANNAIDTPGSNAIAYASGLTKANWNYQQTDGGYYCQWYSASWWHEIFGDYRTGQISVRGNNNGTKTAWRRVLDESNYSTIIGTTYLTSSSTLNAAKLSGTIPASCYTNTQYSAATQSAAGLMSAADKKKLDGVATNANAYTLPAATSSVLGGVKTGSNITNSSGTISLTKANVTAALGYTPPTTNTTYSTGTASVSGLTKLYTGTGTNTDGTMTQSAIKTALDGKAASSHGNHVPTTQTANNAVFLRNDNTWQTVTPANIGAATSGHNHDSAYLKLTGGTVTGNITLSNNGHIILSSGIEIY